MPAIKSIQKSLTILSNLLLPPTCILCSKKSGQKIDLCPTCRKLLPYLKNSCYRCALPLPDVPSYAQTTLCGQCLKKRRALINRTIATFLYQEPVDRLILGLKFGHRFTNGQLLSQLLLTKIREAYQINVLPQLLIPVPLHPKRLQTRGYNQALELAKPLAKALNLTIDTTCCERIKNSLEQARLPFAERGNNIRHAFALTKNQKIALPKHVAIIDDVVTTGNTARELAFVLKQGGVTTIDLWCIAKTALKNKC